MHLFFAPDIGNSLFYEMNRDESHHAIKVLRLHKGEKIRITDGNGAVFIAEIIEPNPLKCYVAVKEMRAKAEKRTFHLHIAISPVKKIDRFEFFIEKATETGIDEITPLICEHSERKKFNHERAEKIIISAMKQSERAYKPHLNKWLAFDELIRKYESSAMDKFIAHCSPETKQPLGEIYSRGSKALILIGPEGDFTSTEILSAIKSKFRPVSLGFHRLRAETAGIVACAVVNSINKC